MKSIHPPSTSAAPAQWATRFPTGTVLILPQVLLYPEMMTPTAKPRARSGHRHRTSAGCPDSRAQITRLAPWSMGRRGCGWVNVCVCLTKVPDRTLVSTNNTGTDPHPRVRRQGAGATTRQVQGRFSVMSASPQRHPRQRKLFSGQVHFLLSRRPRSGSCGALITGTVCRQSYTNTASPGSPLEKGEAHPALVGAGPAGSL